MEELITIGIPVLNRNSVIVRVLDSILLFNYDLKSIKIVVVDGGSTDGTLEAIKNWFSSNESAFDSCILLYERGLSAARNAVIKKLKGNYLFFIDSDVIVPPNGLRFALEKLKQFDSAGMVGLPYFEDMSKADILHKIIYYKLPTKESYNVNLGLGFTLLKKEAIEKVGLFNEKIRMEDTEYSQRMIAAGFKTIYSPNVEGVHLNEHQESTAKFLKTCFFSRPKQIAALEEKMRKRMLRRHVYYGFIPIAIAISILFLVFGYYVLALIALLYLGPAVGNQIRKTKTFRYKLIASVFVTLYITVESWGLLFYYLKPQRENTSSLHTLGV